MFLEELLGTNKQMYAVILPSMGTEKRESIAAVFLDPSEDKLLTNIISDSCGAYGIHGRWCYFHLVPSALPCLCLYGLSVFVLQS